MQVPGSRPPVTKLAYLACLPDGGVVTAHVASGGEVRIGELTLPLSFYVKVFNNSGMTVTNYHYV